MSADNLSMVFAPVLLRDAGEPSFATLAAQKRVLVALLQVPSPAWLAAEHEMTQRAAAMSSAAARSPVPDVTATPPAARPTKSPFRFFGKKRS
jgi:hypothetical protein